MNASGIEIERKYLIRMPREAMLQAMPECEIWDIVQTYLLDGDDGSTHRVRSICSGGETRYIHTVKQHLSRLSQREWEREISQSEYLHLLEGANPALHAIRKRRYRISYADQILEVDLYSFWKDRATLEIELESEAQQPILPDWISIVREVTGELPYKNRYLAEKTPMEEIES